MVRFESVNVYPAFSKEICIEWKLSGVILPGNYLFEVERSGSPEGPFKSLTPVPIVNKFFFIDRTTPLLTKENHPYYRVIVTLPSGKKITSEAKDLFRNLEKRQWLVLREITRKEILRFRKYVGIQAFILKLKHFGEKCSAGCVDPVSDQVTIADCTQCFGTRFDGGYEAPIEAWVEVAPVINEKALRPDGLGMAEDFGSQVRLISYPLVTRGDIIVEADSNRRFHVRAIQPSELRTVPVVQLVSVRQLSRTDIEYKIPLKDFKPS